MIQPGAQVHFLDPVTLDGNGNGRSDIIVEDGGTFRTGTNVVFKSAQEPGRGGSTTDENGGIMVESGGMARLQGLTLARGSFLLDGPFAVSADISVGDHTITDNAKRPVSALQVEDGSEIVLASKSDLHNLGSSTSLAEIIVQHGSSLSLGDATVQPGSAGPDGWYGIRYKGSVSLSGSSLASGERCLHGEGGAVTLGDNVSLSDCGLIDGVRSKSVVEGTTGTISSYTLRSEVPSMAIDWSMAGDDRDDFGITDGATGNLSFAATPDYESPADAAACNTYKFNLRAQVGPVGSPIATVLSDEIAVNVTDNVGDRFPSPPQILEDSDQSTGANRGIRVRLTNENGSRITSIQVQAWSVEEDGTVHWFQGQQGVWQSHDAPSAQLLYDAWKSTGKLFTWPVSPGRTYHFHAKAINAMGASAAQKHTFRVLHLPMTLLGETTPFYYEDWEVPIGTYAARNNSGGLLADVTWSLLGNEAGYFEIDEATGELRFTARRPGFVDGGTNEYTVRVTASRDNFPEPTPLSVTVALRRNRTGSVSVTNSSGLVSSSNPPIQGQLLTAALADLDNVAVDSDNWRWRLSTDPFAQSWDDITDASNDTYEPQARDVGGRVQAVVSYRDDHGEGEVRSTALGPVLAADARGQVTLSATNLDLTSAAPRIGTVLSATLSDADMPVSLETWHWESSRDGETWTAIRRGNVPATGTSYTVAVADRGKRLRAKVRYRDALSLDETDLKTAVSAGTLPVFVWSGSITGTASWSGDVYVGGDVTIGGALTIAAGAAVHFLAPGESSGDVYSELIVGNQGALDIGSGVIFRSAGPATEHGLQVQSGGTATLDGLKIESGTHYLYADPSGSLTLRGDLLVGDFERVRRQATLRLHRKSSPGDAVTVRIQNNEDRWSHGSHPNLVEIIVGPEARLYGSSDVFKPVSPTETAAWHGIRVLRNPTFGNLRGLAYLAGATLSYGQRCLHGEGGNVRLGSNAQVLHCGGLKLPSTISVQENEREVGTYGPREELPARGSYTWAWSAEDVEGEDDGYFTVTGSGRSVSLEFRNPPDHESSAHDPTYVVTIKGVQSSGGAFATVTQRVSVEVTDVDEEPTVTGGPTVSIPESVGSEAGAEPGPELGSYEGEDPEGADLTWSVVPEDGAFELTGSREGARVLRFKSGPDFEGPGTDGGTLVGGERVYEVTVKAADGPGSEALSGTQSVTVTVTDVNEDGTVTLSPDPGADPAPLAVGTRLTATLSDPDRGVSGVAWRWQRRAEGGDWGNITDNGNGGGYMAVAADVGHRLRATVSYTDVHGPGQSAESVRTGLVEAADVNEGTITLSSPPQTCAQLTATLTDADGGIMTVGSLPDGFTYGWIWDPPSASSSRTAGTSTTQSYLPPNSAVGRPVSVTVQYGDNASNRNTATLTSGAVQANAPRSISGFTATGGRRRVDLAWTAPSNDCGATVTYTYRYRLSGSTTWTTLTTMATSASIPSLAAGTYEFELTAGNSAGDSGTLTDNATVTASPGTITLSSPPQTCAQLTATLTDADGGIMTVGSLPDGFTYGWVWDPPSASSSRTAGTSTTQSYLPPNSAVGRPVSVTVQYGDNASNRNTATLTSGAVLANAPRSISGFTATGGRRRADLAWTAPSNDCGATVTYTYRYRLSGSTTWTSSTTTSTSAALVSLAAGTYSCEVKAVNSAGESGTLTDNATVQPLNRAPTVTGISPVTVDETPPASAWPSWSAARS